MSFSRKSHQDSDLTSSLNPEGQLTKLISDGQLTGQASAWLMTNSKHIIDFYKKPSKWKPYETEAYADIQPDVRRLTLAFGGTFAAVLLLLASLGFGSGGIVGGKLLFPLSNTDCVVLEGHNMVKTLD